METEIYFNLVPKWLIYFNSISKRLENFYAKMFGH